MSSIYRKLVVYFLLLNLFAIGSVGIYSYYKEKEALLTRTFDQLVSVRIDKKNRIIGFFKQRKRDVENISQYPHLQEIIQNLNPYSRIISNFETKQQLLNDKNYVINILKNAGCYISLLFIDNSGLSFPIYINDNYNKSYMIVKKKVNWFKKNISIWKNKKEIFISEVNDSINHTILIVGYPAFYTTGHLNGFIIAEISPNAINKIMFENNPNNGLNKTGEVYLVGSDFLMRSNSRFLKNSVFTTIVKTPGVLRALKNISGKGQFRDYRNIPVLSAYSPLDFSEIHWAVLAEIDIKEAMIPIYSIRNNIIYLSLLIALISAAFISLISRKFSVPLKTLKNETKKIATGQFGNQLNVETNDEIGALTLSFNNMSLKLKEQANKLEHEKKLRLRSVIDAQEKERQRLSRELHDGLGPLLLTGKMKLESALNTNKENMKNIINEVTTLFSSTIKEIRNISNNMMPSGLKEFGLPVALQNFCQQIMDNYHIKIFCLLDFKKKHYEKTLEIYIFRIVQEGINNTLKHAHATEINLNIEEIDNHIFFTLQDNGCGFDKQNLQIYLGNGLLNMKERVNLLNGFFELTTAKDRGTRIDIDIPIQ